MRYELASGEGESLVTTRQAAGPSRPVACSGQRNSREPVVSPGFPTCCFYFCFNLPLPSTYYCSCFNSKLHYTPLPPSRCLYHASWFGQQSRVLLLFCFVFIVSLFIVVGEPRFKRSPSLWFFSVSSTTMLQMGVFLLLFWFEAEGCGSLTISRPGVGNRLPTRTKCRGGGREIVVLIAYHHSGHVR